MKTLQKFKVWAKKIIKKLWGGGIKTQSINGPKTDRRTNGRLKQQFRLVSIHICLESIYKQKNKCSMQKKVKNSDAKLLRLDSSPPQFLNGQIYGRTDKQQVEIKNQIVEALIYAQLMSVDKNKCPSLKESKIIWQKLRRLDSFPPQFLNGRNSTV